MTLRQGRTHGSVSDKGQVHAVHAAAHRQQLVDSLWCAIDVRCVVSDTFVVTALVVVVVVVAVVGLLLLLSSLLWLLLLLMLVKMRMSRSV